MVRGVKKRKKGKGACQTDTDNLKEIENVPNGVRLPTLKKLKGGSSWYIVHWVASC
jgi:hypothetical protein